MERFDIQRNSRNAEEIRATVEQAESTEGEFAKGVAAGIRYALGGGAAPFRGPTAQERSAPEAMLRRTADAARRQAPDGAGAPGAASGVGTAGGVGGTA